MAGDACTLSATLESLPLKAPFRIAGHTFARADVALATLTMGPHAGRGEAGGVYYLDDTPAGIVATLEAERGRIERGITRAELLTRLPPGGARNALDCALWDLEARRTGRPAWQIAGLSDVKPLRTTFTLGADAPEVVRAGALKFADAHALKLKLDGDLDQDIARIRVVREVRPDVWLAVDANQGYTIDTLQRLLPTLVAQGVRLLEQPLARGHESELDGFRSPIPLAADESVQDSRDIASAVGRFHVINIKLDKCGGLTEALRMAEIARSKGLRTMVGAMFGTSLAMAPAFIVGQLCEIVDLDAPVVLAADRQPSVDYSDGHISVPDGLWGAYASA